MFNFCQFAIFTFLVSVIFCDDEVVCVPTKGGNEKCVDIFNGVKKNILALNLTLPENIDKLNKNCQDFEKCSSQLKCGAEKALAEIIDDVNAFCEASIFRHTKLFEECDDKLIARNSTCIQEWHPIPELGEDEAKNTELQKIACKEMFGKYGCLEKEMSEACGVDVWNGFKKNQLALNKMIGLCPTD